MSNIKSIKIAKQLRYEILLVFEWFKGKSVKDIFEKLPKDYATLKTVYNYHARYNRAVRKARELTKGW